MTDHTPPSTPTSSRPGASAPDPDRADRGAPGDRADHGAAATTTDGPSAAEAEQDTAAEAEQDTAAEAEQDTAAEAEHDAAAEAEQDAAEHATRFSLEELAQHAGVPARTIRHYRSEKLLPPPHREGRSAHYDERHLERLRLIAQLQDRGLSLKAIRDVLRRVEKGKLDLDEWLGIGEQLQRPWSSDRPELLDEDELAERTREQRPGLLADLTAHGIVQANDTLPPTYLVPSPGLLDVVLRLEAAGVDVATSAEALERLEKHLRRAAEGLVDHVVDRAGQGFGQEPEQVTEALAALPQPSLDAVSLIFGREMERALRDRSERLGTALGKRRSQRDGA